MNTTISPVLILLNYIQLKYQGQHVTDEEVIQTLDCKLKDGTLLTLTIFTFLVNGERVYHTVTTFDNPGQTPAADESGGK